MDAKSTYDEYVELFSRYGWAVDMRDWTMLESCFFPDVVVRYEGWGESINGYAELQDYLHRALDPLDGTQHVFSNFKAEIGESEGSFRCQMRAQHIRHDAAGGPLFEVAGAYRLKVRRLDDTWKMTELRYGAIWWEGNHAVLEHLMDDVDAALPGRTLIANLA